MQPYLIEPTDDLPIEFTGEEIGTGSSESLDGMRWTECRIYRTVGGRYVVVIEQDDEAENRDRMRAAERATPEEIVAWLRATNRGGALGRPAAVAVAAAAERDDGFAALRRKVE